MLHEVSRECVIVFILKYAETEVIGVGNIYAAIMSKETIVRLRPSHIGSISDVDFSHGVRG
jgi:hypothetical protein